MLAFKRKEDGKFRKVMGKWEKRFFGGVVVMAMVVIGFGMLSDHYQFARDWFGGKELHYVAKAEAAEVVVTPSCVDLGAAKREIVEELAAQCESKGLTNSDAPIILDTNNAMSIGRWMWQVKSIQHYVKVFENREITRHEATIIALDEEKAAALTSRVLFEDEKGWRNWYNCGVKLQLQGKIDLIKNLEK